MSLEELASLTSKDRILVYLSEFQNMEQRYELPADLIQQSIAYGTGIQRKHLSQYLKDLMDDNMIVERKAHIQGMKQRMSGYYLTPCGYSKSITLRNRLSDVKVPIRIDGIVRDMKVSQIDDATSVHVTFSDIIREAMIGGSLDMKSLEDVESKKRESLEEKEQDTDVYRRV